MFAACCCDRDGNDLAEAAVVVKDHPVDDLPFPEPEKPGTSKVQDAEPIDEPEEACGGEAEAEATHDQVLTFTATVARKEDDPIGLDIDVVDGVSVVIVQVKEGGAFQTWNEEHPETAIQEHDRIVQVNEAHSDANALVGRLQADSVWALTVQRPVTLSVSIRPADHPELGLDILYAANGKTLLVNGVNEGPVQEWNHQHPQQAICANDRIIELNGVKGSPMTLLHTLMQAPEDTETWNLVVLHYPQMAG